MKITMKYILKSNVQSRYYWKTNLFMRYFSWLLWYRVLEWRPTVAICIDECWHHHYKVLVRHVIWLKKRKHIYWIHFINMHISNHQLQTELDFKAKYIDYSRNNMTQSSHSMICWRKLWERQVLQVKKVGLVKNCCKNYRGIGLLSIADKVYGRTVTIKNNV